jgi:hypothetical protein
MTGYHRGEAPAPLLQSVAHMTSTTFCDRVLVVEDDPATRLGLSELIGAWGFATDAAADGEEALQRITAFRPQLNADSLSTTAVYVVDVAPRHALKPYRMDRPYWCPRRRRG